MALFRIQRASVSTLQEIQPVVPVTPTRPIAPETRGLAVDLDARPAAPPVERRQRADRRLQQRRMQSLPCLIDTRLQHERRQRRRRQDDPPAEGIDQSV